MKFFLLTGGFCGFVLSYLASWNAGNSAAQALCDGTIGCLVGATLFRVLHFMLTSTVRRHLVAQLARQKAEMAQVQAGNVI
jgi:hypothetical protein